MTKSRQELRDEIETARAALAALPAELVVERMGWDGILKSAETALPSAPEGESPSQAVASIFFDGPPVQGSERIELLFAGDALQYFGRAANSQLRRHGAPSDRVYLAQQRLAGSFGFLVEAPVVRQPELPGLATRSAAELAVADITNTLKAAALSENNREFEKALEALSSSAFVAIRDLLKMAAGVDAAVRLATSALSVSLNAADVRLASKRLLESNVTEKEWWQLGVFEGVLPNSRKFEHRRLTGPEGPTALIKGEVDASVDTEPLQSLVGQRAYAKIKVLKVQQGRRRSHSVRLLGLLSEADYHAVVEEQRDAGVAGPGPRD